MPARNQRHIMCNRVDTSWAVTARDGHEQITAVQWHDGTTQIIAHRRAVVAAIEAGDCVFVRVGNYEV